MIPWFVARHAWACFWRDLPFRLAYWLPRSVALGAFVRVYAVLGECGPDFDAYKRFEQGEGT